MGALEKAIGPMTMDHISIRVQPGKVESVSALLMELGWGFNREVSWPDGRAVFMSSPDGLLFQFTDEGKEVISAMDAGRYHIGINVVDPRNVADVLKAWLVSCDLCPDASVEQWDDEGKKWGLIMPTLGFAFEFQQSQFHWVTAAREAEAMPA